MIGYRMFILLLIFIFVVFSIWKTCLIINGMKETDSENTGE